MEQFIPLLEELMEGFCYGASPSMLKFPYELRRQAVNDEFIVVCPPFSMPCSGNEEPRYSITPKGILEYNLWMKKNSKTPEGN
jgi:hypothetical protein